MGKLFASVVLFVSLASMFYSVVVYGNIDHIRMLMGLGTSVVLMALGLLIGYFASKEA